MSVEIALTKENINGYLFDLGKRYRKLSGKKVPTEIILIGGASILINYGFRDVTYDADAIIFASSVMKDAINFVRDKHGLPYDWMNEGVKRTNSYTNKLIEVSVYYRTFSNILEVRTVAAEYLIAMKVMSGRQYKYDLSDIVGILWEHSERGQPITRKAIDDAIKFLYGEKEIPEISTSTLDDIFSDTFNDYKQYYEFVRNKEIEAKEILTEFNKTNPGELKGKNISSVINEIRLRESIEATETSSIEIITDERTD